MYKVSDIKLQMCRIPKQQRQNDKREGDNPNRPKNIVNIKLLIYDTFYCH